MLGEIGISRQSGAFHLASSLRLPDHEKLSAGKIYCLNGILLFELLYFV